MVGIGRRNGEYFLLDSMIIFYFKIKRCIFKNNYIVEKEKFEQKKNYIRKLSRVVCKCVLRIQISYSLVDQQGESLVDNVYSGIEMRGETVNIGFDFKEFVIKCS